MLGNFYNSSRKLPKYRAKIELLVLLLKENFFSPFVHSVGKKEIFHMITSLTFDFRILPMNFRILPMENIYRCPDK